MEKEQRKKQRRRRLLAGGGLLLILGAGIFAGWQSDKEEQKEAITAAAPETKTEEVTATPEPVSALESLQTRMEERVAKESGTWSIYIKDLNTEEEISINPEQMYAASLIKLFVMESSYENRELLEENSRKTAQNKRNPENVEELLRNMIETSDNEAYNELVRLHSESADFSEGCRKIGEYLAETGYENTGIFHTLSPSETKEESIADEDTKNYTCAEDCGKLLEEIYRGTCVSEEASEEMLDFLLHQETTEKIPQGVPNGISVANKTGETEEVQHDAAIVFGEKTDYIICIMSCGWKEEGRAIETIRDLSGITYAALET